jgi:hypothetical protein
MGGLGGFVRLYIFVDREDAEDAVALLRDIRTGDHAVSEGNDLPDDPGGDDRADADGVWGRQARDRSIRGAPGRGCVDDPG